MDQIHIMALGAHPDDIELSMAGLMLRFKAIGARITWVVATDGAAGNGGRNADLAAQRALEAAESAKLAGAELVMLGFPDGLLAEQAGALAAIGQVMRENRIDLVITHGPSDYHADHRALSRCVANVLPLGTPLLFADNLLGVGSTPNLLVDISNMFETKSACLACHRSQASNTAIEALEVWNRFRGLQSAPQHFRYAEAYQTAARLGSNPLTVLDKLAGYSLVA